MNKALSETYVTDEIRWSQKTVDRWFEDNGNVVHRLGHDLNEDSIVFEVGGYRGDGTQALFDRYGCTIHTFEPVYESYKALSERFEGNSKVSCYPWGVGDESRKTNMSINEDGSSMLGRGATVAVVDLASALASAGVDRVNLIDINIEGAEYDLLDYMLDTGLVGKFDNIQIQFHDFFKGAGSRMLNIQDRLSKTHGLTYQYTFCYENWKNKS